LPDKSQSRYHPLQVSLHWLIVLLVSAAFALGKFMSGQPNEAGKIPLIGIHMALGLVTLITMVVRIVVRLRLPKPSTVSTGNSILDIAAKIVHGALYLFVLLMAVSGLSLSIQSGLTLIVFGGSGAPLPPDFYAFNARILHGLIAPTLLFLILLHAGAALYHQFALKDNLLARMWYRKA
jgi:cytochrome b561